MRRIKCKKIWVALGRLNSEQQKVKAEECFLCVITTLTYLRISYVYMYGKEKGNKRLRVWELRSGIRKNEEFLQISAYAYFSGCAWIWRLTLLIYSNAHTLMNAKDIRLKKVPFWMHTISCWGEYKKKISNQEPIYILLAAKDFQILSDGREL